MESEEVDRWLLTALDDAPMGIIVQDSDLNVVAVNRAARTHFGTDGTLVAPDIPVTSMGDGDGTVVVDEHGVAVDSDSLPAVRALRTDKAVEGEVYGLRIGERTWWSRLTAVPMHSADGEVSGVATYYEDITESVEREARHRELLDEMSDGYIEVDEFDRYRFVNRAAASILDAPAEQLVGESVYSVVPSLDDTDLGKAYAQVKAGESVWIQEWVSELGRWLDVRAHKVADGTVAFVRDATEERRSEAERDILIQRADDANRRLFHAATRDPLTGLWNRNSVESWIDQRRGRAEPRPVAVLLIDLDRFKRVNDTQGHDVGDEILLAVADRLRMLVRSQDVLARLGGDEFVVVIESENRAGMLHLAERILRCLRAPLDVRGRRWIMSGSVGVVFSSNGCNARSMLRDADAAMYQAKAAGRNCWSIFDDEHRQRMAERFETEHQLHKALDHNDLVCHYQPQFDVGSGFPVGAEALARWHHPTRGVIGAGEFVPVAEESGLIVRIGAQMLNHALDHLDDVAAASGASEAQTWVNLSARQIDEPGHMELLHYRLTRPEVLGRVGIEVTETALTRDEVGAARALRSLAEAGVPVAIDDFGTGFSSMSRLLDFPIDVVKIDQAFARTALQTPTESVIHTIVDLAHALGARACAEGVENRDQLEVMVDAGVDVVSGFYLGMPVPIDELAGEVAQGSQRLAGSGAAEAPSQSAL